MIPLKSLIPEFESEPSDSNEWDDWKEYLKYFEYEIEKVELEKIIKKYKLEYKLYFDNSLLMIFNSPENIYLSYDKSNETFDLIRDINEWIINVDAFALGINSDNIYNAHVEGSLNDLKQNPGVVYHYTTEEKWKNIQHDKEMFGSYGTGINNRGAHGIFTSVNPEEYAMGTYGDICLKLNLEQFKIDNKLELLNLSFEPEVDEYLVKNYIASSLNIELVDDIPSDISPYTVIVHHNIPLKYIAQI